MKTRAGIAVLFVLWTAAAIGRTVPDVIDRPLVHDAEGVRDPIPLPAASSDGTRVRRAIPLRAADAAGLGAYDEIRLVIGTYDTAPALEGGTLTVAGSCVFRAARARLEANTTVRFLRAAACPSLPPGAADVALVLAFEGASPREARAALWTSALAPANAPLLHGEIEGRAFGLVGRAIAARSATRVSRARLLAFMWDVSVPWVWLLVAAAGALVIGGAVALDRAGSAGAAWSSFALAAGLALSYAAIVPPLQAPDEPDHLLGFAKLSGRPALAEATSAWARRIHFYRMTFMADERFTPADRERAFDRDWPPAEVFAENVRHRSSTATRFWQALAPIVPENPAHAVLIFRGAQAAAFGAAFAAGAVLLAWSGAASLPALLAAVVLTIPALPFFGMQMSELTFTLGAFVLAGYAAMLLVHGASGRLTGPVLGLALALIAGGPRSGWPSLAIVAALAAGRMLSAAADRTRTLADTAWFWAGLALPAVALFGTGALWIPSPFYEQWHLSTFDPRAGISSGSFLLAVGAGAIAGAAAEWMLRRAPPLATAAGVVARIVCVLGAAGIAATLAWSLWSPLPVLPSVESVRFDSAAEYVRAVLVPLATAARVRGFDFLTWTSLWGGYGWADAILPSSAIAVATTVAAGASLVTLVAAAGDGTGRRALVAVCGVAGVAASAAVAAVSSYGLHRNVHGRYLLGGCVIGLCLLAAPALLGAGRRIPASVRAATLLGLVCALHAFAIGFLLERYFG